jgi:hypothetical protein
MTVQKMATRILEAIRYCVNPSFAELLNACGPEGRGDLVVRFPGKENLILWTDVSQLFIDALNLIKPKTEIHKVSELLYLMDGAVLTLDVPSERLIMRTLKRGEDFKKPMWLPVTISLKSELENSETAL